MPEADFRAGRPKTQLTVISQAVENNKKVSFIMPAFHLVRVFMINVFLAYITDCDEDKQNYPDRERYHTVSVLCGLKSSLIRFIEPKKQMKTINMNRK